MLGDPFSPRKLISEPGTNPRRRRRETAAKVALGSGLSVGTFAGSLIVPELGVALCVMLGLRPVASP